MQSTSQVYLALCRRPRFIMHSMSLLGALGVRMVVPRSFQHVVRPRAVVRVRLPGSATAARNSVAEGLMKMDSLLQFEWQVPKGSGEGGGRGLWPPRWEREGRKRREEIGGKGERGASASSAVLLRC